ncbi:MAG: hypothetical protein AA908_07390 [Chlorobi bacterium NICIL-2]|nr:MAG: hypothetical protein AA908_07390 [Chlorobi bacterium NICIL-2]
MCLFLCVLLAGGAVQAQDSSDVLWAKLAYEPVKAYIPPNYQGLRQLGVYWHWSDSVLIVSDLVRGEHRVFEIDARRGIAVREVEELRGKGVIAVLPDTPIVYTRVPYFGKADYRTGRLLDTLRDVPPQGFWDVAVCPMRRQLLGWVVAGDGISSSTVAKLLLYSLDSMRLVDTIPIPRHLPYGWQVGVPRGEQHYLELYWFPGVEKEVRSPGLMWTDDGRYLHLLLEEHWEYIGPQGITQDTYRLRLWLIDVAGRRVVGQMEYGLYDIRGSGGARGYVANTDTGGRFIVFDSSMRIVRIFPNGGVRQFALSPDGRYVMGGTWYSGTPPSIWDVETGERVYQYSRPWGIGHLSYSPSGKYIVDYGLEPPYIAMYRAMPLSGVAEGWSSVGVIYPSPVSGEVTIGPVESGVRAVVEVYDGGGRFVGRMYDGVVMGEEVRLWVGGLSAGVYIVRMEQGRVVRWYTMVKE